MKEQIHSRLYRPPPISPMGRTCGDTGQEVNIHALHKSASRGERVTVFKFLYLYSVATFLLIYWLRAGTREGFMGG